MAVVRQYGGAKRPFPKHGTAQVPRDRAPLDDDRAAARTAQGAAEVIQRDAVRAHCSCPQCAARRAA